MPAKRMNAAVGSTLKVIGKSSAMVSAGPRPGRTPIAVPSVVPTRHHTRFIGVSATEKPLRSCEKASTATALRGPEATDITQILAFEGRARPGLRPGHDTRTPALFVIACRVRGPLP